MKKILFLVASIGLFFLQSCNKEMLDKEGTLIQQTELAKIKANETYTFVLPANVTDDDPFQITRQAANFTVSELGKNADSQEIYTYTPAVDFVGTDTVVISNDHPHGGGAGCNGQPHPEPANHPKHPKHPRGGKGGHDHQEVTIIITVESGVARSSSEK
jgi:hypothetical protein